MGEYICRVADERGKVFVQTETAASEEEIRRRMSEQGLLVYSIRSKGLPKLAVPLPAFSRNRIPATDFLLFNQQFVTLIRAGLPILRALDLLAERAAQPRIRLVLNEVRERVRGGASLSDAFKAQGLFPEVYTASLLAGERSGNLAGVLEQYIAYQKVTGNVRRRLLNAMVYPALLIIVSGGVLSYVTLHVIPRFSELYNEMNIQLPPLTIAVVSIALNLRSSLTIFLLLLTSLVITGLLVSRSEAGAEALDRARMKIPLVGDILLKFRLAQLCRTLATLLVGGIPLVPSLEVGASAMESPLLRRTIGGAATAVSEGKALHAALAQTGVFPELVTEMIEVGENTGALPDMLRSVAEFYEDELNARLSALLTLVEPLLLLIMGGVVLTILVALYLPIFSIGTAVR